MTGALFDFKHAEIFDIDLRNRAFRYRLLRELTSEFGRSHVRCGRFGFETTYVHTAVELA